MKSVFLQAIYIVSGRYGSGGGAGVVVLVGGPQTRVNQTHHTVTDLCMNGSIGNKYQQY